MLILCEPLRCLLLRRGITFQRTKTWKESPPDRDAKLDRIEQVLDRFPDRSLEIRSCASRSPRVAGWGMSRAPRTARIKSRYGA